MGDEFVVRAAAGSLRSRVDHAIEFPHQWTATGVAVDANFTGAHLLHLATAGCVLNDLYREAASSDIELYGVLVEAMGSFDTEQWRSTGITYRVEIESAATVQAISELLTRVDEVAEIPKVIRAGAGVHRVE